MSRYTLVGRSYDKKNNVYIDKVIVERIGDERLSSLKKIDNFTSSHSNSELFEIIRKEHPMIDFSFLSVMYTRDNNNDNPYYYKIIIDDELYNECINNTRQVGRNTIVDVNSKLFLEQRDILLSILDSKDLKKYDEICYSGNVELRGTVRRYIEGVFNNYDEMVELKNMILEEFSKYKTFRQWYVCYKNPKRVYNHTSVPKTTGTITKIVSGKKIDKKSLEEIINDFEKDFLENSGKTYSQHLTDEFNYDNEEFLEEDEAMEMFDYENSRVKKRH